MERTVYRIGLERNFCERLAAARSLDDARCIAEEGAPITAAEHNGELARIPGNVVWSMIESALVATLPEIVAHFRCA